MEKQKLIYVESKAQFSPNQVSDKAIVFIKDTKEIWTHGVYFSCSGTWATPITLSLTGDSTGSVSIDGSGNVTLQVTNHYLDVGYVHNDANSALSPTHKIQAFSEFAPSFSNGFPASNYANAIININTHSQNYDHQLGFSSNKGIYHRTRNAGKWDSSWEKLLTSTNYTNYPHTFASLTNKPTTLSGYGITDCIPIISGGVVTTDTDLGTLGMTTFGAKLSVSRTTDGTGVPSWQTPYSNFLMFRSTGDTYSGIATYTFKEYVTFVGGRNLETTANNVPNWWFRIKGNSGATYDLNSIQNTLNNLDSNYLRKSGGTMTGNITLTTDAAYITDSKTQHLIFGTISPSTTTGVTGVNGMDAVFAGRLTNMVLRTSGDNLYHYNHSKSARYLILDTNNYSSYALPLSGGTMTGALNFANNTWNKVGDDAYMGDCNVAGMIGIKGINADTPGFAMYNNSGTLLGKLYASGTSLYWSNAKILTASGTSTQFVMGDGSLYSDTVSYTTWDKTTTSGIAWFPIADITDDGQGTALFMVRAYAHSSIIFTVVKGYDNGNINVLAGGGNFNNSYAYIRGVRQIKTTVEIGLNAAATGVNILVKVIQPTYSYSLRSSLVESTNTATPYVQYNINSGGTHDFGVISSKFTGNLIGNADTASNISTVNPILAQPFEKNTIQVVSNPQGALAEQQGTAAAITHALRFNWYNTAYEIGNVRGGASNSLGFGITYGNNNLCLLVKTNGTYSPYGFIGDLTGNAASANKWATARTITLTGDVTGSVSLDGSSNVTLTTATSGTGTTAFLKCLDKRNQYPAQIVTSGGNIGAAFMSASKLGLSDGNYYDAVILRGYADSSGGSENALLFSKNSSSVYHSQYAFGSTTTWGTMYKFLDSNNYSSYALPLSGGTMTGAITLTSGSDAANAKTALSFIKSSDKSEQARIGTDTANGLGMYAKGTIYIRPNVTLGSSSTNGLIISNSSFTYNGNAVLTSSNYTNYTIGYANAQMNYKGYAGVISDGKLYYNNMLSFACFVPDDNLGATSYELIAELTNYGTGTNTSYIVYGISGFMWSYRSYGAQNSSSYYITAIVSIGKETYSHIRVPVTTNVLVPFIVKYNDKYYLALRKQSSSTNFYFMGYKSNLLTTSIKVNDTSLIEEIKGPEVETSTAMYYYNNGSPQEYLHAGNYSSYALPLTGGTLTGKLIMQASGMNTLPTIHRNHASYISGIRLENNSGYLGTIGMNAVNGSLYIMGTNETLYPVLDSRNYSDYTAAKSHTHPWSDITSKPGLLGSMSTPIFYPYANDVKLGAYISTINNRFYSADLRYTVTTTNFMSGDVHYLFDDNYDSRMQINMGTTATITIEGYNFVYNNGYIILYFYLYSAYPLLFPKSITAVATRQNGTTYTLNRATSIESGNTIAFSIGLEYLTKVEFTIVSQDNAYCGITNIDYYSRRTENSVRDCAVVTKYNANTLYHNLTAPKYIVSGGTSSQFLKADGSLDSTSYLKVDGTNGTSAGVSTLLNKLSTGSSTPTDADYYICQYAGGGTSTTTYHRRPMSAMYAYIKSKATSDFLPLAGGTLGNSTASSTILWLQSSTANMRLMAYSDSTNYIQSGNSDFSGNATLKITGYSNTTGSNLYFNFANIYCRGNNYTNIDSGNYSSYALPLSGGTLTGTLISRDIRPSANVSYSLGTSSYYYNYVYAKYFKKNGSSDSYVLLGGGGHKAVSDFAPNNVATLSSSGMGNSDQWTLVFEQSYPASHWYEPIAMFYVKGGTVGCGILCFYNYWNSATKLNAYEKEVWFFGAGKSETSATFGGTNRDINDYLRIYIDTANFKYYIYYNRYNDRDVKIQELQFFESPDPLHSSFFTNSTTVVNLPTESSTLVRVPIKTTYNHDRTIKTSKSIYASSFYENSDIRLKENVQRIDQSDLTKQVDLVQFNFKDSDTKKYGVIAQQLEQVGLQNLVYENDGKKAVDYISLLVLEIQRLRNEIGELKQEINKKN